MRACLSTCKRLSKKAFFLLSALLVAGAGILIYSFFFSRPAAAAWMDENWLYRQQVSITNSGSAQTDFQAQITIDTQTLEDAGKIQSDCDDLRITDINGKLLPFWIEPTTCSTSATKIWTKVPSIPADSTAAATLFLYYGNPSAPSGASATSKVFIREISNVQGAWTLDETSTPAVDSSGNGNDGTWTGNATNAAGKFSNATTLDGTGDYITMGNPTALNQDFTQLTIAGWVYITGAQGSDAGLFGKGTNYYGFTMHSTTPYLYFYIRDGGNAIAWDYSSRLSGWHYVVGTFDGTYMKIYVDGSQVGGTRTSTYSSTGTGNNFTIGNASTQLNGKVDDVRFYNKVLSEAEISALYGTGGDRQGYTTANYANKELVRKYSASVSIGSPASEEKGKGPVGYWKFDDGQAHTAKNTAWQKTSTTTNLVTNPSFETNTASWSLMSSGTLSRDNTKSLFGTNSAKLVTTSGPGNLKYDFGTGYTSGSLTASAWVYIETLPASQSLAFNVRHRDTGETVDHVTTTSTTGQWIKLSVTVSLGATDDYHDIVLGWYPEGEAGTFYTDGIQLEQTSSATPFCDGSLTGNGTHSWSGTAHASTSTCDYGNDGQVIGATWQPEDRCVSGKCLAFDGTDDQTNVADHTSLDGFSAYTLSAWIRPTSVTGDQMIVSKDDTGTGGVNAPYNFNLTGSNLRVAMRTSTTWYDGSVATNIQANTWQHVVARYDGSNVAIFVNGVSKGSFAATGTVNTTTDSVRVGARGVTGLPATPMYFDGFIDEVKIYPYARSAAQIKTDYLAGKANASTHSGTSAVLGSQAQDWLSNGLVGYWKMDESSWNGTSGEVVDSSGNGKNGTSSCNGGGCTVATTAAGKFGSGASFNGTTNYVNVGSFTAPATITLSAWAKFTLSGNQKAVFSNRTSNGKLYFGWNESNVAFLYDNDCGAVNGVTSLNDGTWHHIVATSDGATANLYVDGKLDKTAACARTSSTGTAYIGYDPLPNYLNGSVDDIRIYNRALSPKEVSDLYNWAPGPIGYWDFEDGSGSTAIDKSGNGYNGTITGGSWSTGKYGSALAFAGGSQRMTVATSTIPNGPGTVSMWAYLSSFDVTHNDLIDNDRTQVGGFRIAPNATNWLFYYNASGSTVTISSAPSLKRWYYVTVSWDGSTIKFYLDGVLQASASSSWTSTSTSCVLFGNLCSGGTSADYQHFGKLDDVRIYNYARTQKQIVSDMNANHPNVGSPVGSAIGHWKFDEGQGVTANNSGSGGSALNGTLTTMASPATATSGWSQAGKFGKALNFDGSNDYVDAGTGNALNPINITVALWIRIAGDGVNTPRIIEKRTCTPGCSDISAGYQLVKLNGADDRVNFAISNGTAQGVSTTALSRNVWHHIVGTYDGSAVKVYVDGQLANSTPATGNIVASASSLQIGGESSQSSWFQGGIDDVKIYPYALTADEVKLDYNQGKSLVLGSGGDNTSYAKGAANQEYCVPGDSASCAAPVGQWDFNEGKDNTCSGGTNDVCDKSGNGNDGAWNGSGTQPWAPGKVGWAGKFDGSDDYVNVPHNSSLNVAGTFTYEMWVKRNGGFGTDQRLFAKDTGSPMIDFFTANEVRVGGACTAGVATGPAISDTGWHHIAWTRNGSGNGTLYIDGVQVTLTGSFTAPTNTSSALTLGQSTCDGGMWFNGQLDGVKIFNYARSAAQVAYDYNRGAPVGWWKFDECQGSVAHDSTLNANHGTITIGASGSQASLGTCTANAATAWYNGRTGKYNHSLNFDGTDDYVSLGTPSSLTQTGPWTIATWVYTSTINGYTDFIADRTSGGAIGQFFLGTDSSGQRLRAGWGNGVTAVNFDSTNNVRTTNTWQHFAATVDSSNNITLYLNGRAISGSFSAGDTSTARYSSLQGVAIGRAGAANSAYHNGQLDDVRIYNYALTATQVKLLYNNGFATYFAPATGTQ